MRIDVHWGPGSEHKNSNGRTGKDWSGTKQGSVRYGAKHNEDRIIRRYNTYIVQVYPCFKESRHNTLSLTQDES